MTVSFREEPIETFYNEVLAILPSHYEEIAEDKNVIGPLDPDFSVYRTLYAAGKLHILAARDDGKLIGYYIAIIGKNLHYRTITVATEDIYYLAPEYRKGTSGLRLFIEAEKMMRAAGAVMSVAKTKVAHDHGSLFQRLGYRHFESVYMKVLKE
jgi:hypothetical protein